MPVSQRASMFWLQKDVDVRSKNLSRRLADPCRPRIAPVVSNVVVQSVLSAVLRVISIRHLERCCDTLGPFAVIAGEMVPIRKETYHIADAAYSWTDDAVRVSCQPHGNCGAFVPRDDQREFECYCSQSLLRPDTSRGLMRELRIRETPVSVSKETAPQLVIGSKSESASSRAPQRIGLLPKLAIARPGR
jgi:hypothetical protein